MCVCNTFSLVSSCTVKVAGVSKCGKLYCFDSTVYKFIFFIPWSEKIVARSGVLLKNFEGKLLFYLIFPSFWLNILLGTKGFKISSVLI